MDLGSLEGLPPVPAAAALLLAGRSVLALLPSGRPGGHGPRDLAATVSTSLLLGGVLLGLEEQLFAPSSLLVALLPFALLALARALFLPGSLVPGHEVPHDRPHVAARALAAATAVALLTLFQGLRPTPAENWLAAGALGLLLHALREHRRAASARTLLASAAALALLATRLLEPGLLLCAVFLVPWLRRADRRAAWLAALGCAGAGLAPGGAWLGLAGLLVLLRASHPAQRRDAVYAATLPGLFLLTRVPATFDRGWELYAPGLPGAVVLALAALALLSLLAWRRGPRPPATDPGPRVVRALAELLTWRLVLAGALPEPRFAGALPLVALLLGAAWLAPEREAARSPSPTGTASL